MRGTACSTLDVKAPRKDCVTKGDEAQAILVARHAQDRCGLPVAGRVQHLSVRDGARLQLFVRIHVVAEGRDLQPIGEDVLAYSGGTGHDRRLRAIQDRETRRPVCPERRLKRVSFKHKMVHVHGCASGGQGAPMHSPTLSYAFVHRGYASNYSDDYPCHLLSG